MILQQPEHLDNIKWLHEELSKKWKCVERGILGPPGTPNTIQDIRVLNRIITWKENGIWWEPDARHAELVIDLLGDGPRGAKVKTPLAKGSVEDLKNATVFLNDEEATRYRSVAMRAAYLAQDRPDLQVATRSLAQGATTTNYQPHAYAQTSCTIPKVSTTHWHNSSPHQSKTQSICDVV